MPPYYLLLPLAAAVVYALGSIVIKRALAEGVTMDQSFHLTNLVLGLMFLPLLLFQRTPVDWAAAWKPALMGVGFFTATWLTFLGIRRGDVSLVTPIMGTKVVFVALGVAVLMGEPPSVALWTAAVLTAVGILTLGLADLRNGRNLVFTVSVTLASAMMFGLCDVLVSWWAADFGAPTFLAIASAGVAVLSLATRGVPSRARVPLPVGGRVWAWAGAALIGLQAIIMGMSLSSFDDATGINVVYASRGLWVIALVVVFGAWLGNSEHRDRGRAFLWRVLGAAILTAAVVIAVLDRAREAAA